MCLRERGHIASALMFEMHRRYILIFHGKKLTMKERLFNVGYVVHFMRLQRVHVSKCPGYGVDKNSWTYQTYVTMQISCFGVVLAMMAQRDFCPDAPLCPVKIGSDCVESAFRCMDGFGLI